MKIYLVTGLIVLLSGCTDAGCSRMTRYGSTAHVVCYSGDTKIFDSRSTGAIKNSEQSDGYYFKDAADGRLTEVSGNCVLKY